MRKILSLVISATVGFLLLSNDVYAFFGPTHKNITNQAIAYLVEKEGYTDSCPAYEKVADGSVKEDDPLFSMRSWFHYSPKLNSWYASADCDAITWAFTPGLCKAWTFPLGSKTLSNDFNWPNAVAQAGQDAGWTALGHVLHLLEDLAVPAHTRNDPHPFREPLEIAAVNSVPVLPDGELIPVKTDPEKELFQQLRAYSQSRFFSDDTVFQPGLPGPIDVREDDNYFYDEEGRKIAYKGKACEKSTNRWDCKINTTIAQEQFAELGPIAVRYVASLIKYYSSQTNAYPCKNPGTLYAMSYFSGAVYAYDGTSWKPSNIPAATGLYDLRMASYNGKLYVAGYNEGAVGQVYVFDGKLWTLSQSFGTYDEPTALIVHDSKLYIAMTNYYYHRGSIYFHDGVAWQASLAPNDVFLPLCLGTNNGALYAGGWGGVFSLSAGTWRQSLIDVVPFVMASYGGNLYVGANYEFVYKYDGTSWTGLFSAKGGISSLSVYNGALYAGGSYRDESEERNYGRVYKFDGSLWTISLSSPYNNSIFGLSVYGTKLYAGGYSLGEIYVYDGSTWETAFKAGDGGLVIIGTFDTP